MRTAFFWLLQSARLRAGTQQGGQQAEHALRLCVALEPFWYSRVYCREGLSFLEQALATRENVAAPVKARALFKAAEMAWMLDNTGLTETLCAEGLALFRALGDTAGTVDALELIGMSAWARGQYALARTQVEEAATLHQQMGDSWKLGRCFTQLARIATVQGDYDQAHRLLEQSLVIYKTLGDKERIGWVLYLQAQLLFLSQRDIAQARNLTEQSLALLQEIDSPWGRAYSLVLLGQIMLQQGEQDRARDLFEQSLASFKEVGDRGGRVEALMALARIATLQGDLVSGRALYEESLEIAREIDYQEQIAPTLEGLADVAARQGELVRATHLWGAAEALRELIGTPIPPVYRLDYQQAVATARSQSGEDAFARAWSQGRAMTPEQAFSFRPA